MENPGRRSARLAALGAVVVLACGGGDDRPAAPTPAEPEAQPAPVAQNRPPEIRSVSLRPAEPVGGSRVAVEVDVVDPDGQPPRLTYRWELDGEPFGSGGQNVTLPESAKGQRVEVKVVAHDGRLESRPVRASTRVGNRPPQLEAVLLEPAGEIRVGDELVATPQASDPDGDPIVFHHRWLVDGRWVDERGLVLTSKHFERGDEIAFEVRASDGDDESDTLRSSPVRVANTAPVIVSTPASLDESGRFEYRLAVEDADGDRVLRYRLVESPEGMALDWLSGTLAWRPEPTQTGQHAVTVEVDDRNGGIASQTFYLEVGFVPESPDVPAAPAD